MPNLKPFSVVAGALASALSGTIVALAPATPAYAQSGSRLCGYSAPGQSGSYIGLLYEARTADASYTTQCDEAISKIWSSIQRDPQLKALAWIKHRKETCEDVGVKFQSANSPKDMCDKMEAKAAYLVKKIPSGDGATTTYEKQ